MKRLIIDCDPGLDDAVALLLATASPEIAIEAVTVVAGNVALERTAANARAILDHVDSAVPVFAGCPRPLCVDPYDASYIHGGSGLQDLELAPPRRAMDRPHPQPRWGERGIPIHDACVIGHVLWPELFEGGDYGVEVDTSDGPARGRTVVDVWDKFRDRTRKVPVLRSVEAEELLTRIVTVLARNAP